MFSKVCRHLIPLILLTAVFGPAKAFAEVVYTTLPGASSTYGGAGLGDTQHTGFAFRTPPGQAYAIDSVRLQLINYQAPENPPFIVELFNDNAGDPGAPIALIGQGTIASDYQVLEVATPASPVSLQADTTYWIMVHSPGVFNTATGWLMGGADPTGGTFSHVRGPTLWNPVVGVIRDIEPYLLYTHVEINASPADAPPEPTIGIAKNVVSVTDVGSGQYDIAFSLIVENLGSVEITNVQLTDDLAATFPAPVTFSIQSGPTATGTLTANGGFDGAADQNLLNSATSTLAVGAVEAVAFTARVTANGATGPFFNTATVSGQDANGNPTIDASDDGIDPDPNGNGDPTEPGENDPTPVVLPEASLPVVTIAATQDAAEPSINGQFTVTSSVTAGPGGLTVSYTIDGSSTATPGPDYTDLSGSVVIAQGQTTAAIPVVVIDDVDVEPTETVVLVLTDGANYDLGNPFSDAINITSDDVAPPPPPPPPPSPATPAKPVPTLSEWAIITLGAILGLLAVGVRRRSL